MSAGPIRRLDDDAVRRIAAGEVVTDPAAVVEELIENALDAGADRVEVAVERGGIDRVRVADDGHGIPADQAPLAFERHATSKVRSAADLAAVDSLGFRGEALAAVADAADVDLTTRAADDRAVTVTPDGEPSPAGRGRGTTVEVRDLFADRPARRESLSSPAREFAKVSDAVGHYALVHPDVRFVLDHDGDRVFATPGSGDRVDALLGVYDREVAGQATEFATREGAVAVEGVACYPAITRASPDHVYAAVDGRAVADPALRRAVREGYGSLLEGDRYPVAVVDVSVPPGDVDVNVHPRKREVAFADADAVESTVEAAVSGALSTEDLARSAEVATDLETSLESLDGREAPLADLAVIGVFRDLYLLCEDDDRLLVVDGHAAHERVNYERLRAAVGDGVPSRAVDPPQTVALSARVGALLDDPGIRERLETLGFGVERLGEGTCRVEAVPAPMGRAVAPGSVREALESLRSGTDPDVDDALADLACHPSLKAGDDFGGERARKLLDRLAECDQPYACPHGRPTVLSIDEATLVRGFDRANTRLE